jgi:hypothetical protein
VDCIDQVGKELLESIWKTVPETARPRCQIPKGCENLETWKGRPRK